MSPATAFANLGPYGDELIAVAVAVELRANAALTIDRDLGDSLAVDAPRLRRWLVIEMQGFHRLHSFLGG